MPSLCGTDVYLGRAREIVNTDLFNQLESRKGFENDGGECSRVRGKVMGTYYN